MNKLGKFLFVLTSLAPVLAAFGVKELVELKDGESGVTAISLFVVAGILPLLCCLLIYFARQELEPGELRIKKFKTTDKDVLAFLIAYLLPLLTTDTFDLEKNTLVTLFVFTILFFTVFHSNAFHFNPLLACFGYHFYEVESDSGMTYMLISNRVYKKQEQTVNYVKFSEYIYLEVKEEEQ